MILMRMILQFEFEYMWIARFIVGMFGSFVGDNSDGKVFLVTHDYYVVLVTHDYYKAWSGGLIEVGPWFRSDAS